MVALRRIKNKLKKAAKIVKKKNVSKVEPKKEFSNDHATETRIEAAKYHTPEVRRPERVMPQDLPYGYDVDKIVLQVRDPWWLHVYWELRQETIGKLRRELKDNFSKAQRLLRVYDVSNIMFDGSNANKSFDIHINEYATNWYIDTAGPGRSWCVDLGLLLPDGRFITILRSNVVHTPLEGPSWITDEEWMIPEDMFTRLYGLGVGFGSSPAKVKKLWEQRLKRDITSGPLSSVSSPVRKAQERKFWLVVNTELIVYGATEPDAKVTVQGKRINLRPDGTFSLRFALPDGKQVIPVKATSSDNKEDRTITPIVSKETK